MGCFKDEVLLRDLEITAWKDNEENTVLGCIMRCYDYGYKYAGLQVGQNPKLILAGTHSKLKIRNHVIIPNL